MKVNNYNISRSTVVINLTYFSSLIFIGIGIDNPFLTIGIGLLVYSGLYGYIKLLES